MTMILRSSPPSPFGRKVKIAAGVLGLSDRITVEVADTNDAGDSLRDQNPLGKIPVLILENGDTIYDSRVIAEYLDDMAGGGKIIPAAGKDRLDALRLQALADGGAGVIVISQDLDELMEISDSFAVLANGRMSPVLPATGLDIETIGRMMGGAFGAADAEFSHASA